MRTSFLHLAGLRLGYRDPADPETFGRIVEQFRFAVDFAIEQRVAFVVFSGGFLNGPEVEPRALEAALQGLRRLADKNMEVLGIRGKSELSAGPADMTWHDLLAQQGLIAMLDADPGAEGQVALSKCERGRGGAYVDLTRCRVFGLHCYGAMTGHLLAAMARGLADVDSREMDFRILLLHAPLEHFCPVVGAKLSYGDLLLLRRHFDYVALGGYEHAYENEGWAYNPGSSGFYHVLVDTAVHPKHTARYIAYPAQLSASRPAEVAERARRADIEERTWDEMCLPEAPSADDLLARDVVRLLGQSLWGGTEAGDLRERLLEMAERRLTESAAAAPSAGLAE